MPDSHNDEESKTVIDVSSKRYSLCIPTSCVSRTNCRSLEQVTFTAYQIAKAACTFNVSEVIVLQVPAEDVGEAVSSGKLRFTEEVPNKDGYRPDSLLLASLLQYFVTPPYLVNFIFSSAQINKRYFEVAKKLPKISTLPFMQANSGHGTKKYREGMSISKAKSTRQKTKTGKVRKIRKQDKMTKYVNVGSAKLFELQDEIPTNARVTVDLKKQKIVSPLEAYGCMGTNNSYGYQVRIAKNLPAVFTESGYPEGYEKAIFASSGEYYGSSKADTYKDKIEELDRIDQNGNFLLIVSRWKELEGSFNESGIEGTPEQMLDGWIDIPSKSRCEDGCLIAFSRLALRGSN
ncbi:DEKNAAC101365 [Brettanomyces naardenensis]|uniref:DEKNAAC101365 n=1 Tax=Brettanomyces naardenensis TaxID=13370 RepID=A0A448YHK0_BRENA|nr:DEKNAAC101365 [Brettanomyces naardenensis]